MRRFRNVLINKKRYEITVLNVKLVLIKKINDSFMVCFSIRNNIFSFVPFFNMSRIYEMNAINTRLRLLST